MNEEISNSTAPAAAASGDTAAPRSDGEIANSIYGGGNGDAVPTTVGGYAIPDGMKPDAAMAREVRDLVAEMGLPEEAGQKIVDLGAKHMQGMAAKQAAMLTAAAAEWEAQARADTEYGGEQFDANMKLARASLDHFGTPDLKALLNETRLGNHPEFIRFMVRLHNAIDIPRRARAAEAIARRGRMTLVR